MRRLTGIIAAGFCLAGAPQARAAIAPWEVTSVATGVLGIGVTEIYKKDLVPDQARWKTPPVMDASLRSHLVWSNTRLASTLSDVMLYGVVPTSAFLLPLATNHDYSRAALTIAEAAVMTGVVTQIAKFSFARARPYAYYGNDYSNPDSKMSFFSGHTSFSFALSLSSAILLTESYPKYAAPIYSVAVLFGTLTAYLRIAADKHYFTDVLTGAIVGSVIAYGVVHLNMTSNSMQYGDERRLVLQRVFVLQ